MSQKLSLEFAVLQNTESTVQLSCLPSVPLTYSEHSLSSLEHFLKQRKLNKSVTHPYFLECIKYILIVNVQKVMQNSHALQSQNLGAFYVRSHLALLQFCVLVLDFCLSSLCCDLSLHSHFYTLVFPGQHAPSQPHSSCHFQPTSMLSNYSK